MTRSTYLFSAACGFWSVHAALTRWIGRPMTLGVLLTMTFLVGAGSNRIHAADKIGVIVADQAPALEKQAATELAQSLKKIYSAEVVVSDSPPIMATHLILVGTPSSNPLVSRLNLTWPKVEPELASQSIVMKSVTISGLPTLILVGGSSSATYWAVWEFLQELGVRPMLFGDLLPIQPKPIPWQRPESIWTPKIASRGWHLPQNSYLNSAGWSAEQTEALFIQLAKLKFNRVVVSVHGGDPVLNYSCGGVTRRSSELPGGTPITIRGTMAGRKAFAGAKQFGNPDLLPAMNDADRLNAGVKQFHTLTSAAERLGMAVTLRLTVNEFPIEFREQLQSVLATQPAAGAKTVAVPVAKLTSSPAKELIEAVWSACLSSHPTVTEFELTSTEPGADLTAIAQHLNSRTSQPGRTVQIWLARRPEVVRADPPAGVNWNPLVVTSDKGSTKDAAAADRHRTELTLVDRKQILPLQRPLIDRLLVTLSDKAMSGVLITADMIGDLDLPVYRISRISGGTAVKGQEACALLLDSVCGDGVAERVWKAQQHSEQARTLLIRSQLDLLQIGPDWLKTLQQETGEVPAEWEQARDEYANAMNEMYRANTRSRDGGEPYNLYLARRYECAMEYLNAAIAVRKAGLAAQKKMPAEELAAVEQAIESINGALNALAAVSRSPSDRGMIAIVNQVAFLPLLDRQSELEEAAR